MTIRYLPLIVAATLATTAHAQAPQNHLCSYGDLQRRVEIVYETGVTVPCEVHYYKETEAPGEHQVLWRALSEAGFCESKAAEFIGQLEEWGWSCSTSAAPVDDVDQVEEVEELVSPDDTATLAPAEDTERS